MILLEKLLAGLEVTVRPFAVCEVRGTSHLAMAPSDFATVHYTLAGAGLVRVAGAPVVEARPYSFIIVPPGMAHRIEPATGGAPLESVGVGAASLPAGLVRHAVGSGDNGVIMACGTVRVTYHATCGLFDHLEGPIIEYFADDAPIRATIEALLAELANPQAGTAAFVEAVMKQCLVVLLRRHCEGGECRVPWLAALEDARLGLALEAMLDAIEAPHTVAGLATVAAMSRSAFAQHFTAAFGRPPMDFLRELRLRRAAQMLQTSDAPVKTVAKAVGYASRSYFSRAFKAFYGIDPTTYRTS